MNLFSYRAALGALFITATLGACSRSTPPAPAPQPTATPAAATAPASIQLQFEASANLNPDQAGQPTPVRVRLYELKSPATFAHADYFDLADRASTTLGADLLDQDEVQIHPGEHKAVSRELNSATRYVALQVGYRDLDNASWREVISLPPSRTGRYRVNLDARAASSIDLALPTASKP